VTHLRLAWRLLATRGMRHGLTAGILALGLGLMLAAVATADATRTALSTVAARHPLVVGGEIGAVPLVLGSLTRLQDLSAGIDAHLYEQLRDDPRVEQAIPLLGGHAVEGHPLLATSPAYLEPRERYPLAAGRTFREGEMEVVLGHDAALGLGVDFGGTVTIEHQHAGGPQEPGELSVVGVLAPTGTELDRTLFCPVEAIHRSHHEHEHEQKHDLISSILIRPIDDAALLSLQEELDARPGVEVALTGQTLRRLSDQLSMGGQLLRALVAGVVLITFLSLLLAMYGSSLTQAREVGIMRVLGARRAQVVGVVVLVHALVIGAGLLGALGVGGLLIRSAEGLLRLQAGLEASVTLWTPTTVNYLVGTASILVLVAAQPALAAYGIQAADALADVPGSGRTTGTWLRWVLRIAAPLAVVAFLFQALNQHSMETESLPLEPESAAVYAALSRWTGSTVPEELPALDGQRMTIQGYMYTLGDPFTVEDFYLVGMNPRLPRCPFCYRAPTSRERIHVDTGGRTVDVIAGPVEISGVVHVDPLGDHPISMVMDGFEVVMP